MKTPAVQQKDQRQQSWGSMSAEDLEKYETEMELQLYREYRDIVRQFSYVVETERRFYLANQVDLHVRNSDGEVYFEVEMHDAWVWDMYRPARFVKNVRVMTFKDVNVEELEKPDISLPTDSTFVCHPNVAGAARVSDACNNGLSGVGDALRWNR